MLIFVISRFEEVSSQLSALQQELETVKHLKSSTTSPQQLNNHGSTLEQPSTQGNPAGSLQTQSPTNGPGISTVGWLESLEAGKDSGHMWTLGNTAVTDELGASLFEQYAGHPTCVMFY